jgi:osmoprotectant transport system ATP-binding protein
LECARDDRDPQPRQAVRGYGAAGDRPSVAVDSEGEVCVLIGPSGCGKTTTMRIINRMIEPDAGGVTVADAT